MGADEIDRAEPVHQATGRPRGGRPRADQAGEVDRRILDAASELFRQLGYQRTTFEQVAESARASKSTLYARYPTKEDLFTAVVRRDTDIFAGQTVEGAPEGPVLERLIIAGDQLAETTLTPENIGLMRITAAEATTFPDLANDGFRIGFGECVRRIEVVVAHGPDAVPDPGAVARRFVEMALHPLYMHAFFGADLAELRLRARHDVARVAKILLAEVPPSGSGPR